MSIDWIITWTEEERPNEDVIGDVLKDFLYGFIRDLAWDNSTWIVTLRGSYSRMFRRHGGRAEEYNNDRERWFEVRVHPKGMTVTTRMQDDITNCIAAEFARRCAQRWAGELDEPS